VWFDKQRTDLESVFTGVPATSDVEIEALDGNESGFSEREGPQVEGGETL
jgi:hypothetical protein